MALLVRLRDDCVGCVSLLNVRGVTALIFCLKQKLWHKRKAQQVRLRDDCGFQCVTAAPLYRAFDCLIEKGRYRATEKAGHPIQAGTHRGHTHKYFHCATLPSPHPSQAQ